MKYIPAEKLKKFKEALADIIVSSQGICTYQDCKDIAEREASLLIATLQQEPSEGLHFTPLNRLIQKIPSKNWNNTVNNYAKKLRDCLIKEGYLKDAKVLQGYISYMNGNNVPMATMDEQEQPEVDLEKEYKEFVESDPVYSKLVNGIVGKAIARHFYELGLNARKEE